MQHSVVSSIHTCKRPLRNSDGKAHAIGVVNVLADQVHPSRRRPHSSSTLAVIEADACECAGRPCSIGNRRNEWCWEVVCSSGRGHDVSPSASMVAVQPARDGRVYVAMLVGASTRACLMNIFGSRRLPRLARPRRGTQRELVVARRQPSPLLDVTEAPLHEVASLVVDRVEPRCSASARPVSFRMRLLVPRLRDHRPNLAAAQMSTDRSRRVRLATTDHVRMGAGAPHRARDTEPGQQRQQREGRRQTGPARRRSPAAGRDRQRAGGSSSTVHRGECPTA